MAILMALLRPEDELDVLVSNVIARVGLSKRDIPRAEWETLCHNILTLHETGHLSTACRAAEILSEAAVELERRETTKGD